jgi:hypothetical protein
MTQDIELFEVAQMSRAEVAAYNRRAHQHGRHLCPVCLREFDWTDDNFYRRGYSPAGTRLLHTNCKACELKNRKEALNQRYATDPTFRAKKRAYKLAVRASETEAMRDARRAKHREYERKHQEKRRKKPFDAATLDTVDLREIGYWDVLWINRTLEREKRRVCVDCREIKRLTMVNFRVYGKRRGSAKAYQLHVCRVCEKARRGE